MLVLNWWSHLPAELLSVNTSFIGVCCVLTLNFFMLNLAVVTPVRYLEIMSCFFYYYGLLLWYALLVSINAHHCINYYDH